MTDKLSIVNRGNWCRLKEKMRKAVLGEDMVIGFLGGSITQGSLSTKPENCYAYLVFDWWRKQFPKGKTDYVNAGIGGTSSLFGTARVKKDLLMYRPDVVFVDFSVNDEADEFFQETYEGVIRQIYFAESTPAVIILNNVFYDSGENAEVFHNEIGNYYEIPCVSMRSSLYQNVLKGCYRKEEITPDNLHPNDKGHEMVADELIGLLNSVYEEKDIREKESICSCKKEAFTRNQYENAVCLQVGNYGPKLNGFTADFEVKNGMLDLYKNGWFGSKVGDKISFELEGRCIAIQYRKSVKKPVPIAQVTVDGKEEDAVLLDGNFHEEWGDCLYLESILHHGERNVHHVQIEIIEASEQDVRPFYLTAVILA